jgi:hypothetical protein
MAPILGIWASSKSTVAADTGAMFPLQVITVGSTTSTVTFSNIPSTYKHLQIRALAKCDVNDGNNSYSNIYLRFNSDTGSNYSYHHLQGDGSSVATTGQVNQTSVFVGTAANSDSAQANVFGANIIDILEYANTNIYKTVRCLNGKENNATNYNRIQFKSGNWRNTNAITSLTFTTDGNFTQYSQFALYAVKGA